MQLRYILKQMFDRQTHLISATLWKKVSYKHTPPHITRCSQMLPTAASRFLQTATCLKVVADLLIGKTGFLTYSNIKLLLISVGHFGLNHFMF